MDVAVMRRLHFALAPIVVCVSSPPAHAAPLAALPTKSCRAHAPKAAMRSGIYVDVILRVMRAESGGNPGIVSPKGAIGCMQIMPATWTYLSRRYGLGNDPYGARMNMIGGALYLAELARRFGWPGAYAAYNAGPTRYIRYAANGVPLPAETVAYAARLGRAAAPAIAAIPHARWQEAQLFLDRSAGDPEAGDSYPLRLAAAPEKAGTSPASLVPPPGRGMIATLFPLSPNAAPAQR